jgi:hypothetical protein
MLFVLAVCEVIIINVNDQINDPVSKMFEVCTNALSCMESAKIPQPTIFFVQNRKNDIGIFLFQCEERMLK